MVNRFRMALLGMLALLMPGAASAQQAPAAMSVEEARRVYQELVETHDGQLRKVEVLRFATQKQAEDAYRNIQHFRNKNRPLDKLYKTVHSGEYYLFSFAPPGRAAVVNLDRDEVTAPFDDGKGWMIVKLLSSRQAPMPDFAAIEARLPQWVSAGTVPSAKALTEEARLIERSALNALRTPEQLAALPPDTRLDARLSSEWTALLFAIDQARPELASRLLARGASPNVCAHRACPLQLAIERRHWALVESLLAAGADPNGLLPGVSAPLGPLSAAAQTGNVDVARRLIAAGARVAGSASGDAPIVEAARHFRREMVEFLLEQGADIFAADRKGHTAFNVAERSPDKRFLAWIRKRMDEVASRDTVYAWKGWIEQDGRRVPLSEPLINLRRAPFNIVVRMAEGRALFVTSATTAAINQMFDHPDEAKRVRWNGTGIAEGPRDRFLAVMTPAENPAETWPVSQFWAQITGESERFARVEKTAEGLEHVREINQLLVYGGNAQASEFSLADYPHPEIHLFLAAWAVYGYGHIHLFQPSRNVLRFN